MRASKLNIDGKARGMAILLLLASSSYTRVYARTRGTDMGAVITGTVFGVIGPYCTSRKARGHNVDPSPLFSSVTTSHG